MNEIVKQSEEAPPDTIRRFIEARQPPLPDCLYHYTSAFGLKGIVESGHIWATRIQYLNDLSEFKHALKLAESRLLEVEKEGSSSVRKAVQEMLSMLDRLLELEVFVTSFSEEGDLLSQWRAYCPTKGGFSIGLDPKSILSGWNANVDMSLRKCVYAPEEQRKLISDAIDWSLGPNLSDDARAAAHYAQNVGVWFYRIMALTAPILKNPSFYEEKEWRLIVLHSDSFPLRFRATESMLIPYLECPLGSDQIDFGIFRVTIGPTAELELSFASMRRYLGQLGFQSARITTTSIPYRNW